MKVRLQRSKKIARRKIEKRINTINQKTSSSINVEKLLQNSNVIEVDHSGIVKIDYCNRAQKEFAEDWMRIN